MLSNIPILSRINPIPPNDTYILRFILILSSHLRLKSVSCRLLKTLLFPSILATWPCDLQQPLRISFQRIVKISWSRFPNRVTTMRFAIILFGFIPDCIKSAIIHLHKKDWKAVYNHRGTGLLNSILLNIRRQIQFLWTFPSGRTWNENNKKKPFA